jgi:Sulfatase-modifying factor enzyme 1
MRGLRALLLGIRFGLALNLCGAVACGVLDVKRPGPPPPCPSDLPAPTPPPGATPMPGPSPTMAPTAPLPPPAAPAPAPTPAPAPRASESSCPPDMVSLPRFCIDRYEAPNLLGSMPFALRTAIDGEQWCASRGKRLCSEGEWVRACEGPHGRRFPYGDTHRASACNDERPWLSVDWKSLALWPDPAAIAEATRLNQADASGSRTGCVSEEGVYDLTGNVAEWVRRDGRDTRPGYEHVLKGCYWAGCYHEPEPNCAFRNSAHPGTFRTYEAGFRCCRSLDQSASASQ